MTPENAIVAQAMTHLAWADGRLDPREEEMLRKFYLLLGLTEEEAREALVAGDDEPDYQELTRIFPTPLTRRRLMKLFLELGNADDKVSSREFSIIKKVAKILDINKADLDQLRQEVTRSQGH